MHSVQEAENDDKVLNSRGMICSSLPLCDGKRMTEFANCVLRERKSNRFIVICDKEDEREM